jgi:RND superfamily putative drug exporter
MSASEPVHDHPPLYRWGVFIARHRIAVLVLWLGLLGAAAAMYPHLESGLGAPDYSVSGSQSARVAALVDQDFPQLGAEQDVVALHSDRYTAADPAFQDLVGRIVAAVRGRSDVASVTSPYDPAGAGQISADRHAALVLIGLNGDESARASAASNLQDRIRQVAGSGPIEAWLTGPSPLTDDLSAVELHDQDVAESLGIPIALAVLLLALGAAAAAALPVAFALAAVLTSTGVLSAFAGPLHFDRFVTVIATVIGIGIGTDYALFVVSRFREELAARTPAGARLRGGRGAVSEGTVSEGAVSEGSVSEGAVSEDAVREAVGTALATSGRTVVTSGLIVVVALSSMTVIRGHVFMEIAVAAASVVVCCLVAALTLLPAVLTALGHRIDLLRFSRRAVPGAGARVRGAVSRWADWGHLVLRRPILFAVPALLLLGLLTWPTTTIKLGLNLGLASLGGTPSGRGEQIVATSFSPGAVGPVQIIACGSGPLGTAQLDGLARFTAALRADGRVASVMSLTDVLDRQAGGHSAADLARAADSPAEQSIISGLIDLGRGGDCAYLAPVMSRQIDSTDAGDLIGDIRSRLAPAAFAGTGVQADVGGLTAQYVDLSAETVGKLPLVVGIVLALSFCYLLVAYRSVFVPTQAVLLNILATAASLGLTVLIFQDGHAAGLLGFTSVGTLQAYLPVALFALLFGLSMDYEVFLVSRIQEEWLRTGDNSAAIATALDRTARQITAGAAIMVAVFGSLLTARVLELEQFGFALAAAVLLDASVVRMLLVPAVMGLAGDANWWLPRRLARLLPPIRR